MACGVERHPSDAPELPQGLFRCADTPHLRRPAAPPLRRKARRGEALIALEELAECIPSGFSVERTIENKLLIQAFNAFLASQTEAERNLFVARYWYGLPVEEIAAKLGIKKNTALSTLRRMRLRLRDRLEKEGLQ